MQLRTEGNDDDQKVSDHYSTVPLLRIKTQTVAAKVRRSKKTTQIKVIPTPTTSAYVGI